MASDNANEPGTSENGVIAVMRYRESYRIAKSLMGAGAVVQILGIVAGLAVLISGCMIQRSALSDQSLAVSWLLLIISAVLTWASLYVIGLVLIGIGHIVLLSADSAVHSTPFLADKGRAEAMSFSLTDV